MRTVDQNLAMDKEVAALRELLKLARAQRDEALATVARVRSLCDVVRRLQEVDPDTGDRVVSFFALVEALDPDDGPVGASPASTRRPLIGGIVGDPAGVSAATPNTLARLGINAAGIAEWDDPLRHPNTDCPAAVAGPQWADDDPRWYGDTVMSAERVFTIAGNLPDGPNFTASIALDMIVLRVGDQVCMAAPRWLTAEQANRAARYLTAAAGPSEGSPQ